MKAEDIAQFIADAIEDDYPDGSVAAAAGSDPSEVWVTGIDEQGVACEFRITVEAQP